MLKGGTGAKLMTHNDGAARFSYCNPCDCAEVAGIRDPQITRVGGRYFLTGSCPAPLGEAIEGVKLWSSPDLKGWQPEGWLLRRDAIALDAWYRDRFWAPEIHHAEGAFYLTFNCHNEATRFPHSIGIARAQNIAGPYEVVTREAPLVECANDGHLFTDDDGHHYLAYDAGSGNQLILREIELPSCRLVGPPWSVAVRTLRGGDWDGAGVEGSCLLKRGGRYYFWYSSWTHGYEAGVLTATDIRGPWTRSPRNPLLRPRNGFLEVGHNSVFSGPDGRDWLVYHAIGADRVPRLAMDPLWFDADGEIYTDAPTSGAQHIEIKEKQP